MAKKKNDLNDDLNLEEEEKISQPFCAKNLKPVLWILGGLAGIVALWAIFVQQAPSISEMGEAWGEPEKTYKLFSQSIQQTPGAIPMGKPIAAWSQRGRNYTCPNCNWKGTRLAINSNGNYICPHCGFSPFQRHLPTGRGVVAVSAASPQAVLVKEFGMEVVDTARGVMVAQVYGNSWAEKGGLKHGDIIGRVNYKRVADVAQFKKVVASAPSERRVPVRVNRIGKKVRLNVMVGEGEMEGVKIPQAQTGNPQAWNIQAGYLVCPNDGFRLLNRTGAPAYTFRCPRCGSSMVGE